MIIRWHEFLLKDIDSTFRRIEDGFSLKEKIDSAILSPDLKLGDTLNDICADFQTLIAASSIEILLVSNDEWRSCKKVEKDCLAPFPEAKLGGKLAQNVVFAVPP